MRSCQYGRYSYENPWETHAKKNYEILGTCAAYLPKMTELWLVLDVLGWTGTYLHGPTLNVVGYG